MDAGMIIDGFLDDYTALRNHCDSVNYDDYINPVDNVSYPGISVDIPEGTKAEIVYKLQRAIKKPITKATVFMRLSIEGHQAPHQAHNDETMGQYALMLYLNRAEQASGGTSFLKHKRLGFTDSVTTPEQFEAWQEDTNVYDAWQIVGGVDMVPNRAAIFNANTLHRAEPVAGFGDSANNGRLVLVCFFDCGGE